MSYAMLFSILYLVFTVLMGTIGIKALFRSLDTNNTTKSYSMEDIEIKELSFIVRIKYLNNRTYRYCSGVLILPDLVLTTAICGQHNIKEIYQHSVVLFDKLYGQITTKYPPEGAAVMGYIVPKKFLQKQNGIRDNIAKNKVLLGNKVNQLILPTSNQINEPCFSATWYNLSVHLILNLPIVSNDQCQAQLFDTNKMGSDFQVYETELCVLGDEFIDVVNEDGGTPLVCASGLNDGRYVLVGLASWRMGQKTLLLTIFTRVWSYMDWIKQLVFKD